MAEPSKRYQQAQDIKQYLTPLGEAASWVGGRKALAAFASWTFKVAGHPELGAHNAPCGGFLDYRAGLPRPSASGSAYDGAAFLHKASGTLVIANRGTETLEDWINNVGAVLEGDWKQIGPALAMAADAVQAARAILGGDLAQVLVTGNSLGAACAEAQAALLNAELLRRGEPKVTSISGFCNGSAAFGKAIKSYGRETYTGLAASTFDLKDTLQNLIRERDPILAQHELLNGELLGALDQDIASIFVVNFISQRTGSGKGATLRRWELQADASNHNDYYYFRFIDIGEGFHVVKTKSSGFFHEPGEEPARKHFKLNALPEKYH